MTGFSGSSEGSVIAKDVRLTNGELHQRSWLGQVPTPVGDFVVETQVVAPTASLAFDAVIAGTDGSFVLDPFATTTIQGEIVPVQTTIVSAPDAASATTFVDDLGFVTIGTDVSGDYLVSLLSLIHI